MTHTTTLLQVWHDILTTVRDNGVAEAKPMLLGHLTKTFGTDQHTHIKRQFETYSMYLAHLNKPQITATLERLERTWAAVRNQTMETTA